MNKILFPVFITLSVLTSCAAPQYLVARPEMFIFGESFNASKEKALDACERIVERDIVPITAPLAKESQKQIDCYGLFYAGKPRKAELVFQDDQLDLIWILFPAEEQDEIIQSMTDFYGEPTMVIGYGTIYLQANAAVRAEPSEVLFASERQVQVMLKALNE